METTAKTVLERLERKLDTYPESVPISVSHRDLRMVLTELRALRSESCQFDRLKDAYADAVGYEWES
jgi:hypothetical protein